MSAVAITSIVYVQEPGLVPATSPLPYPVSATLSASPGIAPRPGTASSRLEGMVPSLPGCVQGSSEGGKGHWFGDRISLKYPQATNTTLQPIPSLPHPHLTPLPPEKSVMETHSLWVSGQRLTGPGPLPPSGQRQSTNQAGVLATAQKGRENPITSRGARHAEAFSDC